MLTRVLEPEVMDTIADALEYDAMDHADVNAAFVTDLLAVEAADLDELLDLGTGTARIPIEICKHHQTARILAVDLSASMLDVARNNLELAGQTERIMLDLIDAKALPYEDERFSAVISNSIVHHIPEPHDSLADACRVAARGGLLFFRDLMRPQNDKMVRDLVANHAGDETQRAQKLFEDSLRAALSIEEIRDLVVGLGFDAESVTATSDRHWTWCAKKQ